jgi:hypothetical protein
MYNEQIENLINLALADGELTEKEKQILFKKAEALGIDLDEFEMVLDAKLFEKQTPKKTEISTSAPKSDKLGDIKKCPSCGSIAESFSLKCDECGYEFRNVEANQSVKKLTEELARIDSEFHSETSIKSKSTFNDEVDEYITKEERRKEEEYRKKEFYKRQSEAIKNFPIPNTKDDILELLYFVTPKANEVVGIFSLESIKANAWKNKLIEIKSRAKSASQNDPKMEALLVEFEQHHKINTSGAIFAFLKKYGIIFWPTFGVVFVFLLFFTLNTCETNKENEAKSKDNELVIIEDNIKLAISKGEKDKAIELVKKLHHNSDAESQHIKQEATLIDGEICYTFKEFWDLKRDNYIKQLNRNCDDLKIELQSALGKLDDIKIFKFGRSKEQKEKQIGEQNLEIEKLKKEIENCK